MRICLLLLVTLLLPHSAYAETPRQRDVAAVDFVRDIQPILVAHCIECHGPDDQEGQLRLDARATVMQGGVSGTLIKAGHGRTSLLVTRLKSDDEELRMPLDADPLSKEQIELLSRWIDEGAIWPEGVGAKIATAKQHWAYVRPQRPVPPSVKNTAWAKTPLDRFVLSRLEKENLSPSPQAAPATRLRRVYLDLVGLTPSAEEVEAFERDSSPAAYEKVVDRLLASPRFGEKWARGWLDLARYSDSNGYQADQLRDLWSYRDWVIQAMNDDMPYDQFTIEQIAGDLLPNATLSQKIATGFHRTPTCNIEAGVDPEENRTNQVFDRVNTTATVWLGSTFECAQCHNHKYDPFTQKDFYQFFAYFNNTPLEVKKIDGVQFDFYGPKMELPLSPERQSKRDELQPKLAKAEEQLQLATDKVLPGQSDWEQNQAGDQLAAVTGNAATTRARQIKAILAKAPNERSKGNLKQLQHFFLASLPEVKSLQDQVASLKEKVSTTDPDTTLVMVEMKKTRKTHIFRRGEFLNPTDEVAAKVPAPLHAMPDNLPANRLGLAQWLVTKDNPLVARVRVNHWWTEMFGRGIVHTGEDFGSQGELPSHPELLDWLAVEFVESGWSMKHTLKTIVTSATYQQSSHMTPQLLKTDPQNILLARGPRFRMSAETIRDNALRISGLLSTKMGGPPVYPPQPPKVWRQTGRGEPSYQAATGEDRFRRGIYVVWRRVAPYPSFVNFDAPDRTSCVVSRTRTNTPMQALTLLNDQAYIEMAKAFAARVLSEQPSADDRKRIEYAFQTCVARRPTSTELDTLQAILRGEQQRFRQDPKSVEAIIQTYQLPMTLTTPTDRQQWAAWICVANVLLNLDETISKE